MRLIHAYDYGADCVVTSQSYETLCKVKELDPDITTGYILALSLIHILYSTLTAALGSSALTVQPVTAMRRSAAARVVYTGPTALPASTATFAVVASA